MPKIKTLKSMAKRVIITKTKKIKRRSAYISHLLSKRAPARKRRHKGLFDFSKADEKRIKKLLPYLK